MAGKWIDTTIGQQATLQRGFDITKTHQRPGAVPVVSSGGVSSFHDTAAAFGPGVILGRKGVVGSVYYFAHDYWPHDTTLWVKDFHGNYQRFVYYFFRWMAPRIARMDVGSANPTLNRNHVHPMEVRWPPLPEQRAIANVLGALDDKIELNRRIDETLEATVRAIFKSWFVDFDPARAKTEGRQPASAGSVGSLIGIKREGLNPGEFPSELFDHYSIPAFDDGRMPRQEFGESIKSNKFVVPPQTVLLSKLNPRLPRVWLPEINSIRRAVCSTEFIVSEPKPGFSPEFLYCLFGSSVFAESFSELVTGTSGSHQRVKPEDLLHMKVIRPPQALVACFTELVGPMLRNGTVLTEQSLTLSLLRNALLPKLLSGAIRIRDAEKLVEAHT